MKTIAIAGLAGLVLILGTVAAQDAKKDAPKAAAAPSDLKDLKARASYSIGLNVGRNIVARAKQLDLDTDTVQKGIRDALSGAAPALTDAQIDECMRDLQKKVFADNESKAAKAKTDGEAYLAANKAKPGVKVTKTGLQYKVLKEGTGPTPKETDRVKVHYTGTLTDGTKFDSSVDRGEPAVFPVGGVIPGWVEGLQLMKVGSKYQFVIPSNLAYGAQGSPPVIGPDSVLLFDVELLGIE